MRKAKTWIPPTIPLRNDLPAWQILCHDIHDNLIESGLVQTETEGQLDFDAVTELPPDGEFAGFREYWFVDSLHETTPIRIRLDFGCGVEGLYTSTSNYIRGRTPRIKCSVDCGGLTAGTEYPQEIDGTPNVTSQLTSPGVSYYSADTEQGFYCFFYGVGSRNKPFANGTGAYYGSSLNIIIQRFTDENNDPIGGGFCTWHAGLDYIYNMAWTSGILPTAKMFTVTPAGVSSSSQSAISPFFSEGTTFAGASHFYPVFMKTPNGIRQMPNVVTYRTQDVAAGTTFKLQLAGPTEKTFIAIGNETSMGVCQLSGQNRSIAFMFEND